MGQTQEPLGPQSQPLNLTEEATADANGAAEFVFPAPAVGEAFSGTVQCATAPVGASFQATISGTPWGSWGGNSVGGPVQAMNIGQKLTVTAEGLVAGTAYLMQWNGSRDAVDRVQPLYPDANASALAALLQGAPVIDINFGALFTATPTLNGSWIATENVQSIRVQVQAVNSNPSLATIPMTARIFVQNFTQGFQWQAVIAAPAKGAGAGLAPPPTIAPCPVPANVGDQINYTVTLLTAGVVNPNSLSVTITANTLEPAPMALPSGPLGVYNVGGVLTQKGSLAAIGTVQMLAAPPAGMAYRLHRCTWPQGAAAGCILALIGATSAFQYAVFTTVTGAGFGIMGENLNGQPVSEALNFSLVGGNATVSVHLTYDLIAVPAIL